MEMAGILLSTPPVNYHLDVSQWQQNPVWLSQATEAALMKPNWSGSGTKDWSRKGEWTSRDPSIRLLKPVCVPSATWFRRDLGRPLDLIHRTPVVRFSGL